MPRLPSYHAVVLALALASPFADAVAVDDGAAFGAAIERAPAVAAARSQALAARAERAAAGTLPDPELSVNPERNPDLARRRLGVTHTEVLLTQPLPRWGERDAERLAAAAALDEAEAELAMTRGDTAAAAAAALADLAAAEGRARVAREAGRRVEAAAAQLAAALASAPEGGSQQLWALQSRGEALVAAMHTAERDRADAAATARSVLGLDDGAPLPVLALPEPAAALVDAAPAVALARARQLAARAGEQAAGARRRPAVALAVGWEGSRDDDAYEAMITVSLPIHLDAYAAGEDAARARSAAAQAQQARARFEATRLVAGAQRAQARADEEHALAERSRERDRAELSALLAGAGGGRAGLTALLEALDRIAERGQLAVEAEAAAARARAELWRIAPPAPSLERSRP